MSNLFENIYLKSPIPLQQAAVAAYGWWWYRRRFSPHFHRLVSEFQDREAWTAKQFQKYQASQLRKVLAAAWNSSYYQQTFLEAGVTSNMAPSEVLRRVPLLSKEALRLRAKELLTQTRLPKGALVLKTSG